MTTTSFTITPVHQRTRSLPLTEETAIQVTTFQSFPLPYNSAHCLCSSKNCNSGGSKNNINQQQQYHHQYPHHHHHPHHHPHTHHHQTTISHFYNRQNSGSSFDSNHSDHGGAIASAMTTLPLTTIANSMESIVEDQTLQCETQPTTFSDDDKIKSLKTKSFGIGGLHSAGHHFISGSPLSMRRGGRGNSTNTSRSMYTLQKKPQAFFNFFSFFFTFVSFFFINSFFILLFYLKTRFFSINALTIKIILNVF